MAYLVPELRPARILLFGETPGVLKSGTDPGGPGGAVVPRITPDTFETVLDSLGGSRGPDVTGGMFTKVHQMLELVRSQSELNVHILSGLEPGLLTRVLVDPGLSVGTRIAA